MLAPANPRLLERLELFVVATAGNARHFDPSPFGVPLAAEHRFDPLRGGAVPFLDLLCRLDELCFGPAGMAMPRWIFLDGGELSGGIAGLGRRTATASPAERALLRPAADYAGLLPLAMYIAIPTFEPGTWFGHNLASLAPQLPDEGLGGLGSLTKALALKLFRARAQIGAAQWGSPAMRIHTRLGPLEILTAWTPAHTRPSTLTYRARVDDAALRHLARDPRGAVSTPAPALWLESDDEGAMQRLQDRVEAGERLWVGGPPRSDASGPPRLPIATAAE